MPRLSRPLTRPRPSDPVAVRVGVSRHSSSISDVDLELARCKPSAFATLAGSGQAPFILQRAWHLPHPLAALPWLSWLRQTWGPQENGSFKSEAVTASKRSGGSPKIHPKSSTKQAPALQRPNSSAQTAGNNYAAGTDARCHQYFSCTSDFEHQYANTLSCCFVVRHLNHTKQRTSGTWNECIVECMQSFQSCQQFLRVPCARRLLSQFTTLVISNCS